MTNHELSKALWEEALRIQRRDVSATWEDNDFNLCIRRSQEVVELALKAALRFLGADYPKHHDVGRLFVEVCRQKNLTVLREDLALVIRVSSELAEKRGLAYYAEETYNRADAQQAMEDAESVVKILAAILKFT